MNRELLEALRALLKAMRPLIAPLAIILGGGLVALVLVITRPNARRQEITVAPTLVEVRQVERSKEQIRIYQHGVLGAAKEVSVRPEISGKIVAQHDSLVPGGVVTADSELLRIDARDYTYRVEQQRSLLEEAILNLKQEQGRQQVATREWDLLGKQVPTTELGKELALRQAHVRKAEATVSGAQSSLKAAQLALERTVIKAPFNALVQAETVDVGQYITPQMEVARLVGTDEFWVQVSLPVDYLRWIDFPRAGSVGEGAPAVVIQPSGNGNYASRLGKVIGLVGNIAPETRMAKLLISVPDPLGLKPDNSQSMPMLLGAWVDVEIIGRVIEEVVVLPQSAVREGDQVWILGPDNRLVIQPIEILLARPDDTVLVKNGLIGGEQVIISRISAPLPGMQLRLVDASTPAPEEDQ